MPDLRARFGYNALRALKRPLLGEDYVFDPRDIPGIGHFLLVGSTVSLLEKPVTVRRQTYLRQPSDRHTSLHLTLSLCWDGFAEAANLLFMFAESFQGPVPVDAVVETRDRYGIGDFGIAWTWTKRETPDVVCFVRHNVLATLVNAAPVDLPSVARDLDRVLSRKSTVEAYRDVEGGLLSGLKTGAGGVPRAPAAGRLTLGPPDGERDRLFFVTSTGSVNRDLDRPEVRYYRAGLTRGKQEITLYRVKAGLLPTRERLAVEVT